MITYAAHLAASEFASGVAARTTAPLGSSSAWPVSVAVDANTQVAPSTIAATEYKVVMLPRSVQRARAEQNKVTTPPKVPVIPSAVAAVKDIKVVFDGELLDLRATPEVKQGISVAALREIFEHTDGVLYWFAVEKKIRAVNKSVDLGLQIGNPQVRVNDRTETLVLAPYIKRGRTMVPLQFLADTLDVTIRFNPTSGQIVVSSNEF